MREMRELLGIGGGERGEVFEELGKERGADGGGGGGVSTAADKFPEGPTEARRCD